MSRVMWRPPRRPCNSFWRVPWALLPPKSVVGTPNTAKTVDKFRVSQKVVFFVELFLDITLLLTLARNSYRSGGAGTFFWDTPGVLPAAPRALPGHSWTHLGPPRRCVLSSFRPKRHLSTPHVAKRMVEFVSAYAQYCQNG